MRRASPRKLAAEVACQSSQWKQKNAFGENGGSPDRKVTDCVREPDSELSSGIDASEHQSPFLHRLGILNFEERIFFQERFPGPPFRETGVPRIPSRNHGGVQRSHPGGIAQMSDYGHTRFLDASRRTLNPPGSGKVSRIRRLVARSSRRPTGETDSGELRKKRLIQRPPSYDCARISMPLLLHYQGSRPFFSVHTPSTIPRPADTADTVAVIYIPSCS